MHRDVSFVRFAGPFSCFIFIGVLWCGVVCRAHSLDVRNNHISHHHIHEVIVYYAKTPGLRARLELETGGNQASTSTGCF